MHQALAYRQAQTGAAIFARHAVVGLLKRLEQARLRLGINANTGIDDFEAHVDRFGRFSERAGAQDDFTVSGEFDGIADEVEQNLTEPQGVALEGEILKIGRKVSLQVQTFFARLMPQGAGQAFNNSGNLHGNALKNHAIRFDFRNIKDVVKHP